MLLLAAVTPFLLSSSQIVAQSNRGPDSSSNAALLTLRGSISPLAQAAYDHGVVSDSMPADRMVMLLSRSPQRSTALHTFLDALQDQNSPDYHRFLSPAQFAASYGPIDDDIANTTDWLESQGFRVEKVSAGRQAIVFSGTAGQVRQSFHTEIHHYVVNGEDHFANAVAPEIPASLSSNIQGLILGNFGPHPQVHSKGKALLDRTTHRAAPLYNAPTDQNDCLQNLCFGVTPGDFATIYDTKPLLATGIDGTGITIGVVGEAPIDLPSAQAYRQNFLPAYSATNLPNLILDGPAPTIYGSDDVLEAQLDVEEAGGVAPNATVNYYYGAISSTSDGVFLSMIRAVDDNQTSILSISYGGCESYFGNAEDSFFNSLYQQAAAQGITVIVASGDSGSANCDPPPNSFGFTIATQGLAVSGMASTPYNVAVGGTDFYYPPNATLTTLGTYWNSVTAGGSPNNNPDWSSAKGYIPEKPWNISDTSLNQLNIQDLGAGGGGKSSCSNSTGATPNVCLNGYVQPAWQSGFTQDTVRDLPDVSLFASDEGNYSFTAICLYAECASSDGPNSTTNPLSVLEVGGTSVAAPAFAGIVALVEQKVGSRLGQINPVLYGLAKQQPAAFHDIAIGTNRVQCQAGTPNCTANFLTGYSATTGYDLATGLGSVDAAVLVNHWSDVTLQSTTTTLTVTPTTSVHGTTVTFTVSVSGVTSGNIALTTSTNSAEPQGIYSTTCAAFPCTFTYNELPGGTYNLFAHFAGDATHAASTSAAVSVTITPQPSEVYIEGQVGTTYANGVYTQVNNLNGQTLVFGGFNELFVIPLAANATLPTNPFLPGGFNAPASGTISITDNSVSVLTPQTLNAQGNATVDLSTLPVGQHSLVVGYSGDASYASSNSTTPLATPLNFTIAKAPSYITLNPTSMSLAGGSPASIQVLVSDDGTQAVDGSVSIQIASSSGTVTLPPLAVTFSSLYNASLAMLNIPATDLVSGTNTVTVSYAGNSNLLSTTATATINVTPANTTLTIEPPSGTITAGSSPTFRSDLEWQTVPGSIIVSGNIDTYLDGTPVCDESFTAFPSGGTDADCQLTNIQPGMHTVLATYGGDSLHTPASATYTFTVAGTVTAPPLNFGITATSVAWSKKTTNPTGSSTVTLALTNAATTATAFSLSCSTAGLPSGIACTIPSSATIAAGSTQTTTTATLSLTGTTASATPLTHRPLLWLAFTPALFFIRRKKRTSTLLPCLFFLITLGLSSCGSNSSSPGGGGSTLQGPLAPGTYAATVTAKSGSTTQTGVILIRVQ